MDRNRYHTPESEPSMKLRPADLIETIYHMTDDQKLAVWKLLDDAYSKAISSELKDEIERMEDSRKENRDEVKSK